MGSIQQSNSLPKFVEISTGLQEKLLMKLSFFLFFGGNINGTV